MVPLSSVSIVLFFCRFITPRVRPALQLVFFFFVRMDPLYYIPLLSLLLLYFYFYRIFSLVAPFFIPIFEVERS